MSDKKEENHKANASVILKKENMPAEFCYRLRVWAAENNGLSLERAAIKAADLYLRQTAGEVLK
jgi:hypothetical protein